MPPKQQKPSVTEKSASGKGQKQKPAPKVAPAGQERVPAWWVFTKASSTFVERAKVLANLLQAKYGEGVSISHFERMLGELDSMPPQHIALLDIQQDHLEAYQAYLEAKKNRDAERESFRSSRSVNSIETGLAKANKFLQREEQDNEDE